MVTAGFIGLGSQGAGMAQRIIEQGMPTTLWARRAATLEPFRGSASAAVAFAADPFEVGARSDVVGICVTNGAAVREVVLGERGVLAGMRPGSVLAIHSTIGTDECVALGSDASSTGVRVIDAPVSGGGAVAAAGALTVYVGGDADAVEFARPVLETYGNPVFHMGAFGSGMRTKLLNNALFAAQLALAHDSVRLGTADGLDPATLADALRSGSGRSFSLEVFLGLGSFDPIADHVGPIMAKDVGLFARETAGDSERATVLDAADRFLHLIGHPREGSEGAR